MQPLKDVLLHSQTLKQVHKLHRLNQLTSRFRTQSTMLSPQFQLQSDVAIKNKSQRIR